MAVRSTTLGTIRNVGLNTWTDVFVVPAGRTAICRRVSVRNRTGAPRQVRLGVRISGVITEINGSPALAAFDTLVESETALVLNAGHALAVFVDNAQTDTAIHVHASGSLLEGVPV